MQSSRLLHSNEEYAEFQPSIGIRLMGSHARMDRTRRPYTFAHATPSPPRQVSVPAFGRGDCDDLVASGENSPRAAVRARSPAPTCTLWTRGTVCARSVAQTIVMAQRFSTVFVPLAT